jgi:hypothetical protein
VRAAPTATATPRVPGRRRRVARARVLLVLGAVAVALVIVLSGDYQQERELRATAERVLIELRDGEAEEVYEASSSHFQQTLLVDKFVDLVERMNATLGRFERVKDIGDVHHAASIAGMTGGLELDLEFENATTTGYLSFHRGEDGEWRLLGFSVEIPPDLEEKAEVLKAQEERLGAPDEVIDQVHSILAGVREGRAAEVHEGASPAFKGAVTVEEFQAVVQSDQAGLGNFVRVLAIISSAMSPNRDRARVQALLEYEKSKTTGIFEFMRVHGAWRLLSFKIIRGRARP